MSFAHWQQFSLCFRTFFFYYRHQPWQASAILLGIVLAVSLLIGVNATNENAKRSYQQATELLSQQAKAKILPPTGLETFDQQQYFQLRQLGLPVMAVLETFLMDEQGRRWRVTATDFIAAMSLREQALELPPLPFERLITGQPVLLMSETLAERLLSSNEASRSAQTLMLSETEFQVIALPSEFGLGNEILLDLSFIQHSALDKGRLSYIALMDDHDALIAQVEQQLIAGNQLKLSDKGEAMTALTRSFHLNLQAVAMLAFIVGLFISYNGIRYSLLKRQPLLIKLRQLGISAQLLMLALIAELLTLVIIGNGLGFILGLQLSQWLQPMVAVTLEQLYGARLLPGHWQITWLIESLLLTAGCALAACYPLYQTLTHSNLARSGQLSLQARKNQQQNRKLFWLGLMMIIGVIIGSFLSQSYYLTLMLMGVLTVGVPLMLPQLIAWLLNAIERFAPKGLSYYVIAETKELLAPLALAMMAMLLAVSANLAMNTLVSSFEYTLSQWMETRLHADLYVRPRSIDADKVEQLIRQDPKVKSLSYQWEAQSQVLIGEQAHKILLLAQVEKVVPTISSIKSQTDDHLETFFAAKSVMISEPLALRHHLRLGDTIRLPALAPQPIELPISAIYYEYGSPQGEVTISERAWAQSELPHDSRNFSIQYQGDFEPLRQNLIAHGVMPSQMFSQQRIKEHALGLLARTFSVTSVLNSLTLMVAAIGLFTACLMLMKSRQAPLARLYALGVSRRQLFTMVLTQMLLLTLLTALIAIPTGALLAWLLVDKITLQAFGWTLQMQWSHLNALKVLAIALCCSLFAVLLPLFQQIRRPLTQSLQQEER